MGNKNAILWYDCLDSTNSEARRHINDIDNMSVIAARAQTSGRGQRGNEWLSAPGENLTFSLVLKFGRPGTGSLKARKVFSVSEMIAAAICDYLESEGVQAAVKWPNDIYVRGKKICGILVESSLAGDNIDYSIVGVGLNLNQSSFPVALVNPVSLKMLTGRTYDLEQALAALYGMIRKRMVMMYSCPDKLHVFFQERLYRKDILCEYVDYTAGGDGERFMGTIKGITDDALLIVEKSDGSLKYFAFKEISYII